MFEYPLVKKDDIKPGIFRIDHDEYHAGRGISSSVLKKVLKSPAHAKVETEDSPALAFGRAFHLAILEPDLFEKTYTIAPKVDRRTKAGKEEYAGWLAENGEKTILSPEDFELTQRMSASVKKSRFWDRIKDYDVEIAHVTEHEKTGQLLKCKADMIGDWIIDFKSTRDASPKKFFNAAMSDDYRYHLSASLYQDIIEKTTGRKLPFLWVAVEKTAPYGVAWYEVDLLLLEVGREEWQKALDIWHKCEQDGEWPGYPDEIQTLEVPGWFWKK